MQVSLTAAEFRRGAARVLRVPVVPTARAARVRSEAPRGRDGIARGTTPGGTPGVLPRAVPRAIPSRPLGAQDPRSRPAPALPAPAAGRPGTPAARVTGACHSTAVR